MNTASGESVMKNKRFIKWSPGELVCFSDSGEKPGLSGVHSDDSVIKLLLLASLTQGKKARTFASNKFFSS